MKRPSAASLKRVTAENLARLGAGRLAEILVEVAGTRVELKRRLRMELAAEQGAEHLLPEIDRRLALVSTSRGAVSWRQRPALARDLDGVRDLISTRLAALDRPAAEDRILGFLALAPQVARRVRDKDGAVEAVFSRAAADAVGLIAHAGHDALARLAEAIRAQPAAWGRWADAFTDDHAGLAAILLQTAPDSAGPTWSSLLRRLADVVSDPDAYRATFTEEALRTPSIAAAVAARYLRAGRLDPARAVLQSAVSPGLVRRTAGGVAPDPDWEGVWIDYLEADDRPVEAQTARWEAFTRTLSSDHARAYVKRLPDFEDVEAEERIFQTAASHPDATAALSFLVAWPALREAAAVIMARSEELRLDPERAEAWAARLAQRYPPAAERLLRRASAEAFRRRDFKAASRLTEEADAVAG
ncbi:MAG: DUF6880 family protein [Pseudomonadota bacterium]